MLQSFGEIMESTLYCTSLCFHVWVIPLLVGLYIWKKRMVRMFLKMNSSWGSIISTGIMVPTNLNLKYIRQLYAWLFSPRVIFAPFTLESSFAPSWIRPETVMFKERYFVMLKFALWQKKVKVVKIKRGQSRSS